MERDDHVRINAFLIKSRRKMGSPIHLVLQLTIEIFSYYREDLLTNHATSRCTETPIRAFKVPETGLRSWVMGSSLRLALAEQQISKGVTH